MLTQNLFSTIAYLFGCSVTGGLCTKWIRFTSRSTFIIEKLQWWFSIFLEDLWWYINPSKMCKLLINRSIQIYSWSFPEIMNEVFSTRANICNTWQFNVSKIHIPTSSRYGLNSIPYKANRKTSNYLRH